MPMLVEKIKLLCILASQPGLTHVQAEFPGLEVSSLFSSEASTDIYTLDLGGGSRPSTNCRRFDLARFG